MTGRIDGEGGLGGEVNGLCALGEVRVDEASRRAMGGALRSMGDSRRAMDGHYVR